jgi:hypothetical protein
MVPNTRKVAATLTSRPRYVAKCSLHCPHWILSEILPVRVTEKGKIVRQVVPVHIRGEIYSELHVIAKDIT